MTLNRISVTSPVFAVALLAFGPVSAAKGATLYATSVVTNQILRVDTLTDSVTPLLNSSGGVDSLVFDLSGRIIYSQSASGEVRRFDPNTGVDEQLAAGLNVPADLVLEPGGGSVLVSQFGGGTISRIDLGTDALTTLGTYVGNPEGLAYDPSGRLFANLGVRDVSANKFLVELDPSTGAILQQSPNLTSLDGLTYDAFTGQLYASLLLGNQVCGFDPDDLAAGPTICRGVIPNPDGLTSDGAGSLFVAAIGDSRIYQYDFASDTLTPRTFVLGLDDLAPSSGPGSPPAPIPEPYSLTFVTTGLLLGAVALRKRSRRTGSEQRP